MSHGFEGDEKSDVIGKILGITAEQAEQYVTIDTNESDDGLIYNYIAVFDEATPPEVLEAAGVSAGDLSVEISVNDFDEEE